MGMVEDNTTSNNNGTSKQVMTAFDSFNGKPVALQLKSPYWAVVSPNIFLVNPENGEVPKVPAIRGILRVISDIKETRLELLTMDPVDESKKALISINPDIVDFITTIEQ